MRFLVSYQGYRKIIYFFISRILAWRSQFTAFNSITSPGKVIKNSQSSFTGNPPLRQAYKCTGSGSSVATEQSQPLGTKTSLFARNTNL